MADACSTSATSVSAPATASSAIIPASVRRKDGGVEAPVNLGGLFGTDESDGEEQGIDGAAEGGRSASGFKEVYEVQELDIGGRIFHVRQYSWHQANANKVWPGTFVLAQYLAARLASEAAAGISDGIASGRVLELGAATGALSMFLSACLRLDVVTSDIDDGGEVLENIQHNFALNNIAPVPHVAHTWGSGWPGTRIHEPLDDTEKEEVVSRYAASTFRYIVASDILLYVSAYPQLVQTLSELFDGGGAAEFLMAWNRRIAQSALFFDLMRGAGFHVEHLGQCVYRFTRPSPPSNHP